MTAAFRFAVPVAVLAAALAAAAAARAEGPAVAAALFDAGPADARFGDRYERDEDLNTGFEPTEEEVLRLIDGREPGV